MNDGILYCYSDDDTDELDTMELNVQFHEYLPLLLARNAIGNQQGNPQNCTQCQRYKASTMKPTGLLQNTSSKLRFEVVAVDLFGPLPQTEDGFQWILIVEDVASRWTELFPLKEATAEACARILVDNIFFRYGMPRRIKADNEVQFISAIMLKVTYCLDIQQVFTPVYHPETNLVERKKRYLKVQLGILVQKQHNEWHRNLSAIRFAMNTPKCQSTGYSSAFLTFGRELRALDDVNHDVRVIIESENCIPQISPFLKSLTNLFKDAREVKQQTQDHNKKNAIDVCWMLERKYW